MPEVLDRYTTESGFVCTIERDTPAEIAAIPKITFAQFCEMYPRPNWDGVRRGLDTQNEHLVGFCLGTRVPDGTGCFGPEFPKATWCAPGDWHRLYYEARRAQSPEAFAE